MGIRVVEADQRVVLEAPLEPNLNHRDTAFGGSVAAVAILAGWTLTDRRLRAEGFDVRTVIQTSRVRYDVPIDSAFRAECGPVAAPLWDRFIRTLERAGRGRILVPARLTVDGAAVASFEGAYVALRGADGEGASDR